jgi:hypothetical protein
MAVLAYLAYQCIEFQAAGGTYRFFTSFYLEYIIWPEAISQWIKQSVHHIFCKSREECNGLPLVTRAGFKVMTLRQSNNALNGKVQIH